MTKNKALTWGFLLLALASLLGALFLYHYLGSAEAASGGGVSALLLLLAKEYRKRELEELQKKSQATQKTGKEVLAGVDSEIQKMNTVGSSPPEGLEAKSGNFANASTEDLTRKGNDLFKGGTF